MKRQKDPFPLRLLASTLTVVGFASALLAGETAVVPGWPADWMKAVGKTVIVLGTARDSETGPQLVDGDHLVWIDGLDAWPEELVGKRLRVTGVVILRNDLPYRKEGEAPPPDLKTEHEETRQEMKRRFLLMDAKWELLEDQGT